MRKSIYLMTFFLSFTTVKAQDTTTLSLLFVGDVMGHDSQIAAAYNATTKQYDYLPSLQFVKPYAQAVDLAIGNLEVTLAGPPYKGYPQFSSPDALAVALKEVGFDVLVTANNHSVDRGKRGIERTIKILDSLEIKHTGTFVDAVNRMNDYPLILKKNGFQLALLNYTYGTNGIPVPKPTVVNLIDTAQIRKDILKAKEGSPDAVIVFMHWGLEYQNLQSKQQKDLAAFCFKHGADLVIGAHPHVLQPMEWHKDKNQLVVYSLGNFVSGQRDRYKNGGAMAYVSLQKVRFNGDSIVTSIDSAGYYLEWVYRTADAKKIYYVLPVPSFEHNQKFIKDEASRASFTTFMNDSRQLFKKYNINFPEITIAPPDSVVTYKVHIKPLIQTEIVEANAADSLFSNYVGDFYGYELYESEDDSAIAIGNFRDRMQAERVLKKLSEEGKEGEVVMYVNGERR